MRLAELIADLPLRLAHGDAGTRVSGLTDDSRRVRPGFLFIARPDPKGGPGGLAFIPQALAAGAAAVLTPAGAAVPETAAHLVAADAQAGGQALAGHLARRFLGDPLARLRVVAVTGTNGKTTTATLTRQLLEGRGVKCGLIGTVSVDTGAGPRPAELTTPGAIELMELFAEMVHHGCRVCAMEASSHALDQGRVAAIPFAAAAFTNLTGDHLDYHGTMEAYAAAKKKLFDGLAPDATAIVNAEDGHAAHMVRDTAARVQRVGAGLAGTGDLGYQLLASNAAGTRVRLSAGKEGVEVFIPLAGAHNVLNTLQAAGLAAAVAPRDLAGLPAELARLCAVPGRLERVGPHWPGVADTDGPGLPTVLVDYAHTHDAIERVGEALRPPTHAAGGRLTIVFGCGGDRDRTKRPKMARVACELGDAVVVTSDNPRTEDPQAIIREVLAGVPAGAASKVRVEADRAAAIAQAVAAAGAHDTVLIAGKGHEDYQIIGKVKHPFDDRAHAAAALRARLAPKPTEVA